MNSLLFQLFPTYFTDSFRVNEVKFKNDSGRTPGLGGVKQLVPGTTNNYSFMKLIGKSAEKWQDAYGSFCSSHTEAVGVFKDLMKSDRRFQKFIVEASENPLLKKKGVPECIMFVTGRIMKYPLLIDALIKTAKDKPADEEDLVQAKMFVKVKK